MKQFYKFQSAYDIRRNKNLVNTFPEFAEFYNRCKELSNG